MQIFYIFMNEYLAENYIFMNECLAENYIFMNECLAENYIFMNVMGALAGSGIPIKGALRGFCNKIVTRLKHVSFINVKSRQVNTIFPKKVDSFLKTLPTVSGAMRYTF